MMARRDIPEPIPDMAAREERPESAASFSPRAPLSRGRANPTFGPEYWALGLAAALPALLAALTLLACAGFLPLIPRLPTGLGLGLLLLPLGAGAIAAHAAGYPAWSHPGVALIPTLLLFIPIAVLRGQIVARINGDPDRLVAVPLAICWLLLLAATVAIVGGVVTIGRHAPSFSGLALLPLPLALAWVVILAPPFRERAVTGALGTALALAALATFAAWIAPTALRPFVPLAAVAAQLGIFWLQRIAWPAFGGALRPLIALDIALFVGLLLAILFAPLLATWVARTAWPALEQRFG